MKKGCILMAAVLLLSMACAGCGGRQEGKESGTSMESTAGAVPSVSAPDTTAAPDDGMTSAAGTAGTTGTSAAAVRPTATAGHTTAASTSAAPGAKYPPTAAGQTYIETNGNVLEVSRDTVTTYGRNYEPADGGVAFSYTATGIDFSFYGTALAVFLDSTCFTEKLESYVTVYVDDLAPKVVKITAAKYYTVAKDLDAETIHNVKIRKRSEANSGAAIVRRIKIDRGGRFYTALPDSRTRKIQVLGDSITCGVGNLWTKSGEPENGLDYEDGNATYATMLADRFGAKLDVCAISGIGIGNAKNEPWPLLPVYEKEDNRSDAPFDFSAFVPDVVIIGLGTNDDAFRNTGSEFYTRACEYVYTVREHYPDAVILWAYGVMTQNNMDNIRRVIDDLTKLGDDKLAFVRLERPADDELPMGLYGHPSMKTHERMAKVIGDTIADLLHW